MASKKPSKAKAQGPVDTAFNNTDSGPGAPPPRPPPPAQPRAPPGGPARHAVTPPPPNANPYWGE
ncbi:hypothetical protein O9557_22925, partial [Achromobacter ruhlandii]|nr:hypothetical protein [Achromobacter ruhlandii]